MSESIRHHYQRHKKKYGQQLHEQFEFVRVFFQFYLLTFEEEKDEIAVAVPVEDWCRIDSDCGTSLMDPPTIRCKL